MSENRNTGGKICVDEECDVRCKGIGSDGSGVCEPDEGAGGGYVIFARGLLPGETARVRITKAHTSYARADVLALTERAPERREPPCPRFGVCGGCDLMHMPYAAELEYKRRLVQDALGRIGGFADVRVEPVAGDWDGERRDFRPRYRNKGRYAYAGGSFGFYGAASHDVVPVGDCLLQKRQNAEFLGRIADWARERRVGPGELCDVTIRTGERTGETSVMLACSQAAARGLESLRGRLSGMAGVVSAAAPDGYACASAEAPAIHEIIGGLRFRVSGDAFFQVNTVMAERLYGEIARLADIGREDTALDLYCGTGTISLYLAGSAKMVYGVEISERAVEDARENAVANGIVNAEFYAGSAERVTPRLFGGGPRPDVVVLDPPRRGCAPALLALIPGLCAERVVYASCNPATLARDLRRLCAPDGAYRLAAVVPVDLFARTANVETVALLERRASGFPHTL